MKTPGSLGKTYGPECCPSPVAGSSEKNVSYPGVYLTFDKGEDISFPAEGTITFRYRLTGASARMDKDQSVSKNVDMELQEIISVSGGEKRPEGFKSVEQALAEAFGKAPKEDEAGEEED